MPPDNLADRFKNDLLVGGEIPPPDLFSNVKDRKQWQAWVLIAFTLVRPGFSPAGPQQSMAIVEYGITMVAGLVALFLAFHAKPGPPVQSGAR